MYSGQAPTDQRVWAGKMFAAVAQGDVEFPIVRDRQRLTFGIEPDLTNIVIGCVWLAHQENFTVGAGVNSAVGVDHPLPDHRIVIDRARCPVDYRVAHQGATKGRAAVRSIKLADSHRCQHC